MGAIKRMDQIIDILTIYQRTGSINATFKAAGCSRNTVRTYLRLAKARNPDLSVVLKLPRDELWVIFYPKTTEEPPDWQRYFEGQVNHWVKELRKVGVTRRLTNVLEKNLDLPIGAPDLFTPPEHENIRGSSAYT